MDLNQFKTQYGTRAVEDLLDIILIKDLKVASGDWRMFCVKHGIVKQTTSIVRCYFPTKVVRNYDNNNDYYFVTLRNGQNREVLRLKFSKEELESYKNER